MTYSIKLSEKQFSILLGLITTGDWYDIVKPDIEGEFDDDVVELGFGDIFEYGNAYLSNSKYAPLENKYRLNCEAYCKMVEENPNWRDDFDIGYYKVRKIK